MVAVAPLEHSAAFLLFELQERRHRRLHRLGELGHQDLLDAYLSQANLMHGLGSSFLLKGSDVRPNLALLNDLTDQIRAVSGYADFLGPVTPDSLWALGYHDPVVYLLAGPEMGYALVFQTSNPPRYGLIRLPQFTRQAVFAHGLRCRFLYEREEDYEVTLQQLEIETSWCWKACMRDVCSAFQAGSRLTMIPLEYATFLPLHLAWTQDAGASTGRRYALDHLVLSYAPSLRIAGHVRRLPVPRTASPLAAIAPSADGDLPYSGPEVRYAGSRYGRKPLVNEQATRDAFIAQIGRAAILHFAGHARSSISVPWASNLFLRDAPLTALELARRNVDCETPLAILSACASSLGSVAKPEQALSVANTMLVCGFRGVVASLWRVIDSAGALLMCRFHETLDTSTHVPETLRAAQQWLRDAPPGALRAAAQSYGFTLDVEEDALREPFAWGAFIHTGL
jgi:hypothetical protein